MTTGITQPVKDGKITTLNEYIWKCARQFGALAYLRESPDGVIEIPKEIELDDDYHQERLASAREQLKKAEAWSTEEAQAAASSEYDAQVERQAKRKSEEDETRERYEDMLAKAMAWEPPTPHHQGLKDLMVEQLEQSIKFDCDPLYTEPPVCLTPLQIRERAIQSAERDIEYHEKEMGKVRERAEESLAWLTALRDSAGEPPPPSK